MDARRYEAQSLYYAYGYIDAHNAEVMNKPTFPIEWAQEFANERRAAYEAFESERTVMLAAIFRAWQEFYERKIWESTNV